MTAHNWGNRWLMLVTLLLALIFSIYPLDGIGRWLRPEFVVLLVIYWVIHLPQEFGPGLAWLIGLFQDLVEGSIFGQHALALVVVAYICLLSYQRLRTYELWQQSAWVFVLVGIHQLFDNWVNSLNGNTGKALMFLLPAIISALCWPVITLLMNRLRYYYRLN